MGADFSRVRFNPILDYAGVELEQGRVLLDADSNEMMAIVDRRLRALAGDTLGRSTVSSTTPDAFKITAATGTLLIGKGRLYVDGLLAENHGAASSDQAKRLFDDLLGEPVFADPIRYDAQPYLPNPPPLPTGGRHLVYLEVWNREVTDLEQPDLIESAVGVDTSSRLQTVWQVRVLTDDAGANTTCGSPDADVPGWSAIIAPSTGVLSTGIFDVAPVEDPCELPPTGGYRGLENQLYRVEIHDAGQPGAGATFKWSRNDVGSRIASMISGAELELETLGRDDVLRFNTGDWVEITDDVRELSQAPGEMRRITVIEATRRIQFTPALPAEMVSGNFHLRVRRWDQKGRVFRTDPGGTPVQVQNLDEPGSTGVIAVPAAGTTLLLENGVTVSFDTTKANGKGLRAQDYWVFAARTADASVEILDRAPPRGIHHHYARLGIWDVLDHEVLDCRHTFPTSDFAQICAINWVHPTPPLEDNPKIFTPIDNLNRNGVLIAFDRPVLNGDIHRHSFMVLVKHSNDQSNTDCWCELPIKRVGGVKFERDCEILSDFTEITDPNAVVNGAQFRPGLNFVATQEYRVILKGDFIRDAKNEKGIDADHLPPWLPTRPTGDGTEGGTFESWFVTGAPQVPAKVTGVEPPNDAQFVAGEAPAFIEIFFDKRLQGATVNVNTVQVIRLREGDPAAESFPGIVAYEDTTRSARFTPPGGFPGDLSGGGQRIFYTLHVIGDGPTRILDVDNLALDGNSDGSPGGSFTSTFTVAIPIL
jgi:hypothetical protein